MMKSNRPPKLTWPLRMVLILLALLILPFSAKLAAKPWQQETVTGNISQNDTDAPLHGGHGVTALPVRNVQETVAGNQKTAAGNETQWSDRIEERKSSSRLSEEQIKELLEEPWACDFGTEVSLKTVLDRLGEKTSIPFIVTSDVVEALDYPSEIIVNAKLPFLIPLKSMLDYLVKQHTLAWHVQNDAVYITDINFKPNDRLVAKVYYVGDLLHTFPYPGKDGSMSLLPVHLDAVAEYLRTMVAPETWNEEAKIQPFYRTVTLLIRQTESVHTQIADFLHHLREANNLLENDGHEVPMSVINPQDLSIAKKTYTAELYDVTDVAVSDTSMVDLVNLIKATVSPFDWGESATIEVAGTKLVIVHTSSGHESVSELLHQLRKVVKTEDANVYRLGPGDTVGIFIEGITGTGQPIPVYMPSPGYNLPPATGYAFTVRDDGTLALPKILQSLKVEGLTLNETQKLIRRTYVEEAKLLGSEAVITVSLIRPRDFPDGHTGVVRPEAPREGHLLIGRVVDADTKEPLGKTDDGNPIRVGFLARPMAEGYPGEANAQTIVEVGENGVFQCYPKFNTPDRSGRILEKIFLAQLSWTRPF